MEANEYQIGGSHYKIPYEHWDAMVDSGNNVHYLLGVATKYPSRWREKDGVKDLRKTIHYLAKAEENGIKVIHIEAIRKHWVKFVSQLKYPQDADIIMEIIDGNFDSARLIINALIEEIECGPGKSYIDPDGGFFKG